MKARFAAAAVVSIVSIMTACGRGSGALGLQRMYVLDCGRVVAKDQARWTPGVNVGRPRGLSNSCYLFQHARGTLLWETGVPDSVSMHPAGVPSPNGAVTWFRDMTLRSQLERLGVALDSVTHVAVSHTHGDHVGNLGLFTRSRLLIQAAEHDSATRATPGLFGGLRAIERLAGDHDVFGDSSLVLISTPGHTSGHQSLLVRLPSTGTLLLTGDLVHFQYMWDHRIVPPFNFDRERSLASIERVAALIVERRARLWIGHDSAFTATLELAPRSYR